MLNFNSINSMFCVNDVKSLVPKKTSRAEKSKIYEEKIIAFITENTLCTIQQIARDFGIRQSTIHNIIVRLESAGKVARKGLVRGAGTKYAYTFAINEV